MTDLPLCSGRLYPWWVCPGCHFQVGVWISPQSSPMCPHSFSLYRVALLYSSPVSFLAYRLGWPKVTKFWFTTIQRLRIHCWLYKLFQVHITDLCSNSSCMVQRNCKDYSYTKITNSHPSLLIRSQSGKWPGCLSLFSSAHRIRLNAILFNGLEH